MTKNDYEVGMLRTAFRVNMLRYSSMFSNEINEFLDKISDNAREMAERDGNDRKED